MYRFDYPIWIDPVIITVGPVQLTWYALAYMGGLLAGWLVIRARVSADRFSLSPSDVDDLLVYVLLGVIVGGRIGNFLFGWGYDAGSYTEQLKSMFWPIQVMPDGSRMLAITGMSFHGGFLGVVAATLIFWVRRKRVFSLMRLADYLALVAPIGLFFGRIANFINRELYGRSVEPNSAIGINFYPEGNPPYMQAQLEACLANNPAISQKCYEAFDLTVYRHPSQLYEAFGEGLLLLAIIWWLYQLPHVKEKAGLLTGVFITGYGVIRTAVEYVRSFDPVIGLDYLGLNRSQELSLPMIVIGILLMFWASRRDTP
ncbi:MAG: prolipoprotein diacylglyceryl transferase [Alphaproteobacteria bacterium]